MFPSRMNVHVTSDRNLPGFIEKATLLLSAGAFIVSLIALNEGANAKNQVTTIDSLHHEINELGQISATESETNDYIKKQLDILNRGYLKSLKDSAQLYSLDEAQIDDTRDEFNKVYLRTTRQGYYDTVGNWMTNIDYSVNYEFDKLQNLLRSNTYIRRNTNVKEALSAYKDFLSSLQSSTSTPNPRSSKDIYWYFTNGFALFDAYIRSINRNTLLRLKQFKDDLTKLKRQSPQF